MIAIIRSSMEGVSKAPRGRVGVAMGCLYLSAFGAVACGDAGAEAATEAPSGLDAPSVPDAEHGLGNLTFQYKGGVMKEAVFETPDGPQLLHYEEVDGMRIFQGDILLPSKEPDYRSGVTVDVFGDAWPSAIVPYENTGLANSQMVLDGIRYIEERTVIRFIPGATTGNRLRFKDWTNNWGQSSIGMVGGAQDIFLCSTCGWSPAGGQATVAHELGHALGLFHEQQRTDRNNFVTINPSCILPDMEGNFSSFGRSGFNFGPYDITSLMQYSSNAFSNNPGTCFTITAKDGSVIPSRTALTGFDTAGINSLYNQWYSPRLAVDYTGDRKVDLATFRPLNNTYEVFGVATVRMGTATSVPVPGDYDGDQLGDIALWDMTGAWNIRTTRDGITRLSALGRRGDMPAPADFDGDRKTDIAVWRMWDGMWSYVSSRTNATVTRQWGLSGDKPAPADYDGDGKADFAVYRPTTGNWYIINSTTNTSSVRRWGVAGDIPVPSDYDGDGKNDLAVFRPHNGNWHIINSSTNTSWSVTHGVEGDIPVPGDWDGDGKADLIYFRPSMGHWFIRSSINGGITKRIFGQFGDVPVP